MTFIPPLPTDGSPYNQQFQPHIPDNVEFKPVAFPYQEIARLQRLLDAVTVKHSEALQIIEELRADHSSYSFSDDQHRPEDEEGEKCEGPSDPGMSEYSKNQLLVERQREVWHHRQTALELATQSCANVDDILTVAEGFYTFITGEHFATEDPQAAKDAYFLQGWAAAIKEVDLQAEAGHYVRFMTEQLDQINDSPADLPESE